MLRPIGGFVRALCLTAVTLLLAAAPARPQVSEQPDSTSGESPDYVFDVSRQALPKRPIPAKQDLVRLERIVTGQRPTDDPEVGFHSLSNTTVLVKLRDGLHAVVEEGRLAAVQQRTPDGPALPLQDARDALEASVIASDQVRWYKSDLDENLMVDRWRQTETYWQRQEPDPRTYLTLDAGWPEEAQAAVERLLALDVVESAVRVEYGYYDETAGSTSTASSAVNKLYSNWPNDAHRIPAAHAAGHFGRGADVVQVGQGVPNLGLNVTVLSNTGLGATAVENGELLATYSAAPLANLFVSTYVPASGVSTGQAFKTGLHNAYHTPRGSIVYSNHSVAFCRREDAGRNCIDWSPFLPYDWEPFVHAEVSTLAADGYVVVLDAGTSGVNLTMGAALIEPHVLYPAPNTLDDGSIVVATQDPPGPSPPNFGGAPCGPRVYCVSFNAFSPVVGGRRGWGTSAIASSAALVQGALATLHYATSGESSSLKARADKIRSLPLTDVPRAIKQVLASKEPNPSLRVAAGVDQLALRRLGETVDLGTIARGVDKLVVVALSNDGVSSLRIAGPSVAVTGTPYSENLPLDEGACSWNGATETLESGATQRTTVVVHTDTPGSYVCTLSVPVNDPLVLSGIAKLAVSFQIGGSNHAELRLVDYYERPLSNGFVLDFGSTQAYDLDDQACGAGTQSDCLSSIIVKVRNAPSAPIPLTFKIPSAPGGLSPPQHFSVDTLLKFTLFGALNGGCDFAVDPGDEAQCVIVFDQRANLSSSYRDYLQAFSATSNDPNAPAVAFTARGRLVKPLLDGIAVTPGAGFGEYFVPRSVHRALDFGLRGRQDAKLTLSRVLGYITGKRTVGQTKVSVKDVSGVFDAGCGGPNADPGLCSTIAKKWGVLKTVEQYIGVAEQIALLAESIDEDAGVMRNWVEIEWLDSFSVPHKEYIAIQGGIVEDGPQGVQLLPRPAGEGPAKAVQAVPLGGTIDFGALALGATQRRVFDIMNNSGSAVAIQGFGMTGQEEFFAALSRKDIPNGQSATLTVTALARRPGSHAVTLSFEAVGPAVGSDPFFAVSLRDTVCNGADCGPPPPPGPGPGDFFLRVGGSAGYRPGDVVDLRSLEVTSVATEYHLYLGRDGTSPALIDNAVMIGGGSAFMVDDHQLPHEAGGFDYFDQPCQCERKGEWFAAMDLSVGSLLAPAEGTLEVRYRETTFQDGRFLPTGEYKKLSFPLKAGWEVSDAMGDVAMRLTDERGREQHLGVVSAAGSEESVASPLFLGMGLSSRWLPHSFTFCNASDLGVKVRGLYYSPGGLVQSYLASGLHLAPLACQRLRLVMPPQPAGQYSGRFDLLVAREGDGAEGMVKHYWFPVEYAFASDGPLAVLQDGRGYQVDLGGEVSMTAQAGRVAGLLLRIWNRGNQALQVSKLKVQGVGFSLVTPLSSGRIAVGKSAYFRVRFRPPTAGEYGGGISFDANDGNGSYYYPLKGVGRVAGSSALVVQQGPSTLFNGGTFSPNIPPDFAVLNTGAVPVQLTTLRAPAGWEVAQSLEGEVGPGAQVGFSLRRLPPGTSVDPEAEAVLSFETDEAGGGLFEFVEAAQGMMAVDDSAVTDEGRSVVVEVTENDSGPDGEVATLPANALESPPSEGLAVRSSDSAITYTPRPGFLGEDSFTYSACSATGSCDTAVVVVEVRRNGGPQATPDRAVALNGLPVRVNVLANDSDPEGDALWLQGIPVSPAQGTARVISAREIEYDPDFNIIGTDTFEYEVTDGRASARASVEIELSRTNNHPVAVNDDVIATVDVLTMIEPLLNDYDPDTGVVLLSAHPIVFAPMQGSVVPVGLDRFAYTPNAGYSGFDAFTYEITDTHGLSARASVRIRIDEANVAPVAVDDVAHVRSGGGEVVDVAVTANDYDPDAGDVVALLSGSLSAVQGTATYVSSSTLRYRPPVALQGTDVVTYRIIDGHGGEATGRVSVAVTPNHVPVAVADSASTFIGVPTVIDVVANDMDEDGDTLVASLIGTALHGTVTINDKGEATFTPEAGFYGQSGFEYVVSDGHGGSAGASVTVSVENRLPTTVPDVANTTMGQGVTCQVTANDYDADGHSVLLTMGQIYAPHGTVTRVSHYALRYTPVAGFTGTETIQYRVTDSIGTSSGVLTVNVQ